MSDTPYDKMIAAYAKRTEQMRRLRAAGWTLKRIGVKFDVSAARVGKLLGSRKVAQ